MKRLLTILTMMLSMCGKPAFAQFLGGFFNQNATQRKYLREQIVALQVQIGKIKKANDILKKGTGLISNIKDSDLNMHTGHFDSLKIVSNKVKHYAKVQGIIDLADKMTNNRPKVYARLTASGQFSADELTRMRDTYSNLNEDATKDLNELEMVITDGKLRLNDDQRIAIIDRLYAAMLVKYGFQQRLNLNALTLAAQRQRNRKETSTLRSIYGLE